MSWLRGRGVVVTGASGGIGSALCGGLADRGATVYAVGRDPQRLSALRAAHPGALRTIRADLSTVAGVAELVAALDGVDPKPSVLVLAAAVSSFGLFDDLTEAALSRVIQTNLLGSMRLVQALLPHLQSQAEAAVVAIGSTFGSIGFPGFAAYSASKFGLRGFMEALAREHADGRVRFQYLSPRATRTGINPPAVEALNEELGTAVDEPLWVAQQVLACIERGVRRRQFGFPEKLFVLLNGVLPALIDRALAKQLPVVRRHAPSPSPAADAETTAAHLPTQETAP